MNNKSYLKQARKGIKKHVEENPTIISIFRKPRVEDGFGGYVESPTGEPDEFIITCRLSHEQQGPDNLKQVPAGLSTNLSRFIIVDYETTIYENDTFEAIDKNWMIGPVDPLIKFGGTIGYQAPLREAEEIEST